MKIVLQLSILGMLYATPNLSAQAGGEASLLNEINGELGDRIGQDACNFGDFDGDGVDDYLITSSAESPERSSFSLYSGATDNLIYQRPIHGAGSYASIGGGKDFDGDGIPDFAIGFGSSNGLIHLYSGAHGALIRTILGSYQDAIGEEVLLVDDLNGDAIPDLVASGLGWNSDSSQRGTVKAYSTIDGSQIFATYGNVNYDRFGTSVIDIGDSNGDGITDFLVGAPDRYNNGIRPGAIYLLSGIDGARTLLHTGTGDKEALGSSLALMDDLDGDGIQEILVGAAGRDTSASPLDDDQGGVTILAGNNYRVLREHNGSEEYQRMGHEVAVVGDYDGDGFREYVVSSLADANHPSGFISMFSGTTGLLLHNFEFPRLNGQGELGSFLLPINDSDGDGKIEFLTGDNDADNSDRGAVYRFSFDTFLHADQFTASAATGEVVNFTLDFPTTSAGLDYKVLVSAAGIGPVEFGIDIPLTPDSLLTDSYAGLYPLQSNSMHGQLDAQGNASASVTFPSGLAASFVGRRLFFAGIAEPSGQQPTVATTPVSVVIVP